MDLGSAFPSNLEGLKTKAFLCMQTWQSLHETQVAVFKYTSVTCLSKGFMLFFCLKNLQQNEHQVKFKLIGDYNVLSIQQLIKSNKILQCFFQENMKVLPMPYWIPRMHELPIGTRFIITSKQCFIKPLSKNITTAFI